MPSISNSFCVSINASISPAETLLKITSLSDYYFLNLNNKVTNTKTNSTNPPLHFIGLNKIGDLHKR